MKRVVDSVKMPDRVEYFEIMPRAGYIKPGETEVFYISFYPRFAGVFTQSWVLDFSPKLLTPLKSIKLLGIAIEEFGNRLVLSHFKSKHLDLDISVQLFTIPLFLVKTFQCSEKASSTETRSETKKPWR
jgi:hypothetical protein